MNKITTISFFLLNSIHVLAQTGLRGGESENISEQKTGVTHAILIGISDYKNLPESHQLNFADDDATLFEDYLKTQGSIVLKTFLNAKASGKDLIGREIQNILLNEAKAGDHVLIYFAGHGDIDTLTSPSEGFLLLNNVDPPVISSYEFSDALSLNSIRKIINSAAEKRGIEVTLIADACHSGAVKNGAANNALTNINSKVTTITSCKSTEVSEESINWGGGHGVFTYYLIQGLIGMADAEGDNANNDGVVTLDELEGFVKSRVSKDRNKLQSPIFESNNSLSFLVNQKLLGIIQSKKTVNHNSFETFNSTKSVGGKFAEIDEPCKTNLQLFYQQTVNGKFFPEDLDSVDRLPFSFDFAETKQVHSKKINAIDISYDGFLTATGSAQGLAITTGTDLERVKWLKEVRGEIQTIDFSPNKYHLALSTSEMKVQVWDVTKSTLIYELAKVNVGVSTLKYATPDLLVIGTLKGSIILWDLKTNSNKEYKLHKGAINSVAILGQKLFTAGADNMIYSFDLNTGKKSPSFSEKLTNSVSSLTLLPLKNVLVGGTLDGKIVLWDLATSKTIKEITTDVGEITGLSADPSNEYCFFTGLKQKKTGFISLQEYKLEKSKLYTTGSATGVVYDPSYRSLRTIEYDGSYTIQKVKILPQNSSALALYEEIKECEQLRDYRYKIDGTIIVGLNVKVNETLDQLVNGKNLPDPEQLEASIRNAKAAYEIGKDDEFAKDQLRVNLLLLQVYDIILNKRVSEFTSARKLIEEIEQLEGNEAYVYNVTANLYLLLNDLSKAKEAALKAEKLSPNWTETIVNTGKILQQTGDIKGAETHFKKAIQTVPEQSKGFLALGDLYFQVGKYNEAIKQFEMAYERNPSSSEIRSKYKQCYDKIPLSSKPTNTFDNYLNSGKSLINNQTLFQNFNNEIKFVDLKIPTKCRIICEDGKLTNYQGKWFVVPNPGVKLVHIKLLNVLTEEEVAVQTFPVKPLPELEFLWGKSKDGGFVSMKSPEFYLGYLSEPELQNSGVTLVAYEAVFIDENTSLMTDFNPNTGKAPVIFQGEGTTLHPGIFSEIRNRQASEIVGKLCVQYLVKYPSGATEVKSACFSY